MHLQAWILMKFVNFANSIASQTAISCFECRAGGTNWGRGDGRASSVEPSYKAWYETSHLFCFKNWCLQDKTFEMLCINLQLSRKVRLESKSKENPVNSWVSNIESDDSQNVGLEDYNNISVGIFPCFTTPSIKITLG